MDFWKIYILRMNKLFRDYLTIDKILTTELYHVIMIVYRF